MAFSKPGQEYAPERDQGELNDGQSHGLRQSSQDGLG